MNLESELDNDMFDVPERSLQHKNLSEFIVIFIQVTHTNNGLVASVRKRLTIEDLTQEGPASLARLRKVLGIADDSELHFFSGGTSAVDGPYKIEDDEDLRAAFLSAHHAAASYYEWQITCFLAKDVTAVEALPRSAKFPPYQIRNQWDIFVPAPTQEELDAMQDRHGLEPRNEEDEDSALPSPGRDGESEVSEPLPFRESEDSNNERPDRETSADEVVARTDESDIERERQQAEADDAERRRQQDESDAAERERQQAEKDAARDLAVEAAAAIQAAAATQAAVQPATQDVTETGTSRPPDTDDVVVLETPPPIFEASQQEISYLFEDRERYPYMFIPDAPDLKVEVKHPRKKPSFTPVCTRWEVNTKLTSSSIERIVAVGDDDEDEHASVKTGYSTQTLNTDHINLEDDTMWKEVCRFFGFNPAVDHPKCGVRFEWWAPQEMINSIQMWTIGWVMKQLLLGSNTAVISHQMGIGKTACGLALLSIWSKLGDPPPPTPRFQKMRPADQQDYMRPQTLIGGPDNQMRDISHKGPTLVVVPPNLINMWLQEAKRFLPHKMVVALYGNVQEAHDSYGYKEDIRREHWPKDFRTIRPEIEDIHPYELLSRKFIEAYKRDGGDASYASDWIVITSTKIVSKTVMSWKADSQQRPNNGARIRTWDRMDVVWGMIVVDECHEERTWSVSSWKTLGTCVPPGHLQPPLVVMSGTPWNKANATQSYIVAGEHSRYQVRSKGSQARMAKKYVYDSPWQPGIKSQYELVPAPRLPVLSRRFVRECPLQQFVTNGEIIKNHTQKKGSAKTYGQGTAVEKGPVDQEVEAFAGQWEHYNIGVTTGYIWKPFANARGLPATSFRPHTTFDLHVDIDRQWESWLYPHWDRMMNGVKGAIDEVNSQGGSRDVIAAAVSKLKHGWRELSRRSMIFSVYPMLAKWCDENTKLKREFSGKGGGMFMANEAYSAVGQPETSELWRDDYMEVIHASPQMRAFCSVLRGILTQGRELEKGRKQKRKMMVYGHTPAIAAVSMMYVKWLISKGRQAELGLSDDEKVVYMPVTLGMVDRAAAIDTIQGDLKARLLMACSACIESGHNLVRLDAALALDCTWESYHDAQAFARYRRPAMVQRSLHTEGFRLVCSGKGFNEIQLWMARRLEDFSWVRDRVEEHIAAKSRKDDANTNNAKGYTPVSLLSSKSKKSPAVVDLIGRGGDRKGGQDGTEDDSEEDNT